MTRLTGSAARDVTRQRFRPYFQPSRIVLGLVPEADGRVNVITLCFAMHCSYRPPMIAVAIHNINHSHALFASARSFVLSVPGESLAAQTLGCGIDSGRDVDKLEAYGLRVTPGEHGDVPVLTDAIGNVELEVCGRFATGDHLTVVGRALRFSINERVRERNLISVGPRHAGCTVLARRGIHRIGVIDDDRPGSP